MEERNSSEPKQAEARVASQTAILNAINKVFRKALTCETEEEVGFICLAAAEELTGSKFGFIGEINPKTGLFDTIALSDPGWEACKVPKTNAVKLLKNMKIRGVDRATMRDEKPRIVNDLTSHPDHIPVPKGHPPVTCFLGVPLKHGGKTIGMIGLGNKEGGYEPADQQAVEALSVALVEALMHKHTQVALLESEEKFRSICASAQDAIIMADSEGKISYWNEAAEKMFGYSMEEAVGNSIRELIIPDRFRERHLKGFKIFQNTGQGPVIGKTIELTALRKDRTEFPIELSLSAIKIKGKWNAVGTLRDISERKRTEEALKESVDRYQSFVRSGKVGIVSYDKEFRVTLWNSAMEQMTGLQCKEVLGKNAFDCFPFLKKAKEGNALKDAVKGEETRVPVSPFDIPQTGRHGYFDSIHFPLYDAQGTITGGMGIIRDVTEQKKAEMALEESEERYRKLIETAGDAIFMADTETGIILDANKQAEELTGIPSERIIGMHYLQLHPKEDAEYCKKGFENAVKKGHDTSIGDVFVCHKDGRRIPVEISSSVIELGGKKVIQGIFRDITERKRAEEKLKVLRELDKNIIAHTVDYNEVFETATHLVNKVVPCDRVTMVLVDEKRGGFVYCYGWGTAVRKKGDFVPFEMTDASRAVGEKRIILRNDLRQEGELKPLDKQFLEEGFLSDIRVPLIIKGKVAGLLNIGSRRAGAFTREDVTTVEQIAGQLSVALENSLLFKKLEKSLEEVEKSSKRVTHILESITDGFFALDREWRFTYVNPAAERHLLKKREGLIGRNIWDEFPEAVGTVFYREYHKAVSERIIVKFEEFYPPLNIWFEVHAYPSEEGLSVYFRDVTGQRHVEEERKQSLEKLRKALGGIIRVLVAAVETRDPYTAGHQQRVTHLARAIAQEMGLSLGQIEGIRMAGAIHDIGKIAVPAEILSKPGKITETEFDIIKTHPQVGYDILKGIEFPWPVAKMVLQHQERLDGSGYPAGLKGDEIIMEARILAVADVVEAMASHRPYRPALGIDKALEEISENRGILYDADVVDACVRLFREKGFKFG